MRRKECCWPGCSERRYPCVMARIEWQVIDWGDSYSVKIWVCLDHLPKDLLLGQ
jgi:hypothetical protein